MTRHSAEASPVDLLGHAARVRLYKQQANAARFAFNAADTPEQKRVFKEFKRYMAGVSYPYAGQGGMVRGMEVSFGDVRSMARTLSKEERTTFAEVMSSAYDNAAGALRASGCSGCASAADQLKQVATHWSDLRL